jgi:hypothetical protein
MNSQEEEEEEESASRERKSEGREWHKAQTWGKAETEL